MIASQPDRHLIERILFANEGFYAAFAGGDIASMDMLWACDVPVSCIHPGWGMLVERDVVIESWREILRSPPPVSCVGPVVHMQTPTAAFVLCFEEVGGSFLIATNGFVLEKGQWRMTHHQAGPTQARPEPKAETEKVIN